MVVRKAGDFLIDYIVLPPFNLACVAMDVFRKLVHGSWPGHLAASLLVLGAALSEARHGASYPVLGLTLFGLFLAVILPMMVRNPYVLERWVQERRAAHRAEWEESQIRLKERWCRRCGVVFETKTDRRAHSCGWDVYY